MTDTNKERLREAVRFFYDLQKLRIQSSNRNTTEAVDLSSKDADFLDYTGKTLNELERKALNNIKRLLKGIPIYEQWLSEQKGCGPTMSGLILSEIDITRCATPSGLWRFCGLAVDPATGQAERRKKGEKTKYSPWLKSKILHVLGECMIKANSPWRQHYDNYKHRKECQIIPQCMACAGTGKVKAEEETKAKKQPASDTVAKPAKSKTCDNCAGTGGPAPWGKSKAHRHNAAMRVMVKAFLLEMWTTWRKLENLPVTEPYAVAMLGRRHGDHGGIAVQAN